MARGTKRNAECHPDKPQHARGLCNNCYMKDQRKDKKDPSKLSVLPLGVAKSHPDRVHVAKGLCYECYQGGPARTRRATGYQNRMKSRMASAGREKPSLCEVCGFAGKICWDHNHETGKFRGWICHQCNIILGMCRDSVPQLLALVEYLKRDGVGSGPTSSRELNEKESLEQSFRS